MYRPQLDVEALVALDMHVHIEVGADGRPSLPPALAEAASHYFKADIARPDLTSIAGYYRERSMAAVVFTVDARTNLGHEPIPSAEIAAQAADHADVLIPFGSIDPLTGSAAIDLARELAVEHGVRGFKLHPTVQGFDPSDDAYRPLWAALAELELPVVVHSGQTGIGAGMPGGYGFKLRYSNPMLLDDVLAENPTLRIVFAHPAVPWVEEQLSIATHKPGAWIDLSGWSPKYFPPPLVRAFGSYLQDRVVFGSDFPLLTPDRWMSDFAALEVKDEVRPKILTANALRLLGLQKGTTP